MFQNCQHKVWSGTRSSSSAGWQPPACGYLPRYPLRRPSPWQPEVHATCDRVSMEGDPPGRPLQTSVSSTHAQHPQHNSEDVSWESSLHQEINASAPATIRRLSLSQCLCTLLRYTLLNVDYRITKRILLPRWDQVFSTSCCPLHSRRQFLLGKWQPLWWSHLGSIQWCCCSYHQLQAWCPW